MKIDIDVEKLREKRLFVATPMYGGQCAGMYTKATNDLTLLCGKMGIDIKYYFLFNESLITRARNYCVDEFIRSDSTHMIFIDSDIGFDARNVLTLLHLCDSDKGYDIVTGPYPKKTISWEKVKKAVEMGKADNPFDLENYVGDYVFNTVGAMKSFRVDEPVEIAEGGTGFMMIDKKALIKYSEAYPELKYKPDHARTANFDGSREITAFFDCVIDPESRRYLSEDYMFSKYARKIGLKVWMCPWMQSRHIGSYTFKGSLAHIAEIGASSGANKQSNRKNYLTNNDEPSTINNTANVTSLKNLY